MPLTATEVRTYIEDTPAANLLMDNVEEFSDGRIDLAMELAVSTFNVMPPAELQQVASFPVKSILLYGTLAKLFEGQAALSARNTMNYSDGGITLPIEERYGMYLQLAEKYNSLFMMEASRYKVQVNLESGWGEVSSDYNHNPIW